jgi:hypothetical protein
MKVLVGLLAALSMIGVVTTFGREYDSALFARATELDQVSALSVAPDPLRHPYSIRATRELLDVCLKTKASILYLVQPVDQRTQIDLNCRDFAARVVDRIPTLSAAHLTSAVFAPTADEAIAPLVMSQATAPFDIWEARQRVAVGLRLYAQGDSTLRTAMESDVAFLLQLRPGRSFLAQMYATEADIRPVITDLAESAPTDQQAGFVAELRRNVR